MESETNKKLEISVKRKKKKIAKKAHLLTSKKLSTKTYLVMSYVFSIFTYGCDTMSLTKDIEDKIKTTEMWYSRKIFGNNKWIASERISNESVLQMLKCRF